MDHRAGGSYLQPLNALGASANVTLGKGRVNRLLTDISPLKILIYIFLTVLFQLIRHELDYSVIIYMPQISNLPAVRKYFNASSILTTHPTPPQIFCSHLITANVFL